MYIEFNLPKDSGQAAAHSLILIRKVLVEWGVKYNIPYTEKTVKYTHRVCFDDTKHYSFFAMTWNIDKRFRALERWSIITDPNNKI